VHQSAILRHFYALYFFANDGEVGSYNPLQGVFESKKNDAEIVKFIKKSMYYWRLLS